LSVEKLDKTLDNSLKNRYFMCLSKWLIGVLVGSWLGVSCARPVAPVADQWIVRVAEIEVDPVHLEAYLGILKEEAATSIRVEPGVWVIFPMVQKNQPSSIRLLEIYANRSAYEKHLQTPHFKHYKTATAHMVKSLKLIDMEAIDKATMAQIFCKMEQGSK
jgi:4-carboxymuconolactone decarboxylase